MVDGLPLWRLAFLESSQKTEGRSVTGAAVTTVHSVQDGYPVLVLFQRRRPVGQLVGPQFDVEKLVRFAHIAQARRAYVIGMKAIAVAKKHESHGRAAAARGGGTNERRKDGGGGGHSGHFDGITATNLHGMRLLWGWRRCDTGMRPTLVMI